MNIFTIIIGLTVLFSGRKLFWVFVGYMGFIAGFHYVTQILAISSGSIVFLIALGAGIIGALLALFLQHAAILVSGFIAGGYLAIHLFRLLSTNPGELIWLVSIIGGILGAVLLWGVFDYALIFLSAFVGASTIITAFPSRPQFAMVVFSMLFLVGIIFQALLFRKEIQASKK